MFTGAHHWPLSWTRLIQSAIYHSISLRSISFLQFSDQLSLPCVLHASPVSSWFDDPNNILWKVQMWSSSLRSILQPPTIPNILLSTLLFPSCANNINMCFLLIWWTITNVRNLATHPVEFEVESTGVAYRLSIVVTSPQSRCVRPAVSTRDARPPVTCLVDTKAQEH
jgi:hypothetical protein